MQKRIKKLFICAVFAISAMMAVTPAMALDNDEHVIQPINGLGDLLFFPHYVALSGGWETKVTVTNTDDQRSVVARVVVRSAAYSQELLDFLIYLSPGDMWTGKLYYKTGVGPSMYSTDDSCQSGPSQWADVIPLDQPLAAVCSGDVIGNGFGYVEVIEAWSSTYADFACTLGTVDLGPSADVAVSKICIWEAYADFNTPAGLNDSPFNVLTGHYEVSLAGAFLAADQATVLRDYDQIVQRSLVNDIWLPFGYGTNNSLCELEAALSKDPINLPYINNGNGGFAIHWITFPTKLSVVNAMCTYATAPGGCESPSDTLATHVFETVGATPYSVVFSPKYWDLSENSLIMGGDGCIYPAGPCTGSDRYYFPYGVNFYMTLSPFISSNYKEGWIRYDFDAVTKCAPLAGGANEVQYTGVPAIALAWIYNADNGVAIVPSSHINGTVSYNNGGDPAFDIPYYQSHNAAYDAGEFIVGYPGEFVVSVQE